MKNTLTKILSVFILILIGMFSAKLDSNKVIKGTSVWKNSSAYLKYTSWIAQLHTGCFANKTLLQLI